MKFSQFILLPFSLVYAFATTIRNKLFDWNILKSKSFDKPIISVGNLNAGGTGKTPHVEYLINLLKDEFIIATLSRGYKRKTKGFIIASDNSSASEIGDEPFQIHRKFPGIAVAVDEKRVHGINKLQNLTNPDTILLDDAFQHRYVKPGLSILLTDYHNLYTNDYPIPSGRLRECRSGAKRADIIIVTKTSRVLSPFDRKAITGEIKPANNQKLFFSYIEHGKFTSLKGEELKATKVFFNSILLVAGIANPYPLESYLKKFCDELEVMKFPDHHNYTEKDVFKIIETFEKNVRRKKAIVTTEKDAMRLIQPGIVNHLISLPVFYIPIRTEFHKQDKTEYNKYILDYVRKNSGNDKVHSAEN
jgi:tetraacyldisaccharide 4'-kinase